MSGKIGFLKTGKGARLCAPKTTKQNKIGSKLSTGRAPMWHNCVCVCVSDIINRSFAAISLKGVFPNPVFDLKLT